jgi:hypothetical protein
MVSVLFWVKRIAVIGALALGGTAAGAATVTFDFTGGPARAPTMGFSAGGLDLLVSADHFSPATGLLTGGGKVTQTAQGLGERSGKNDSSKLDGNGRSEILLFAFSSKVVVQNVVFALIGQGSEGVGFADGTMLGSAAVLPFMDVSAFQLTSDNLGIGAATGASAFRIASITVTSVPLPAGGALLASALLLPFLRRKRRA